MDSAFHPEQKVAGENFYAYTYKISVSQHAYKSFYAYLRCLKCRLCDTVSSRLGLIQQRLCDTENSRTQACNVYFGRSTNFYATSAQKLFYAS
jgi:hypothetical protein